MSSSEHIQKSLDEYSFDFSTLLDFSQTLNSILELEQVLDTILFTSMGKARTSRAIVMLKDDEKLNNFKIVRTRGIKEPNIIGTDLLFNEIPETAKVIDNSIYIPESITNLGMVLIVPIIYKKNPIGLLLLGQKMGGDTNYTDNDLYLLTLLASISATAIENTKLFKTALEKKKIEDELNIAKSIQKSLLPNEYPQIHCMEFWGVNETAEQVGGDYYDFIPIPKGKQFNPEGVGIVIADVSGKSISSALLMAEVHATLHTLIDCDIPLQNTIKQLNRIINKIAKKDETLGITRFVTLFYGIIDKNTKTLNYINAGHDAPILFKSNGEIKYLEKGGLLLGFLEDAEYQCESVELHSGDILLLYTDGLTEARRIKDRKEETDEEYEEFGIERVVKLISDNKDKSTKEIGKIICSNVINFIQDSSQYDDLTFVLIKIT